MAFKKILFTAALAALSLSLFSQSKAVEKANLAYKYKQFAQAAGHYEQAIAELEMSGKTSKATLNLKTKLAYCYRMNNKLDKAEALYAEIVQDEKAKSKTYLYYGETLMSNGKYDEAKKWFLDYQILEPTDKRAALLAENCDKVKLIEPYFPYVDIHEFAHNSDADDNAPVIWQNGIVFSSDRKTGPKLMKEKSGWTGRDYLDLYFSKIKEDGSFGEPKRFSAKLSEINKNTGNASFAADGSEVFFTRNDNVLNKRETYNLQLFVSKNNGNGKWKKAEKLPFCSPNYNFMHPAISPDGSQLFFATNRKGEGGTDLWVSKRKGDTWGSPKNLGPTVNTSANEGFPFMDQNGRLYFCSKGLPGYGGFDIFFTEQDENGNWQTPQNLGRPINSPLDDISIFLYPNGEKGLFTSSRQGGDDDIYLFEVLDHPPAGEPFSEIETPVNGAGTEKIAEKKEVEKPVAEDPAQSVSMPQKEEIPFVEKEKIVENEIEKQGAPNEQDVFFEKQNIETEPEKQVVTNEPEIVFEEKIIENEIEKQEAPNKQDVFFEKQNIETEPEKQVVTNEPEIVFKEKTIEEKPEKPQAPSFIPDVPENNQPMNKTTFEEEKTKAPLLEKEEAPEKTTTSQSSSIFFDLPEKQAQPAQQPTNNQQPTTTNNLPTFGEFISNAGENVLRTGQVYRINGATFDPNIWQLTLPISKKLDQLVAVMRRYPNLQIELGAHTESLGIAAQNLELSQNRADMAVEYIVKEGISADRIKGVGYGETVPLNHCQDGVTCSMEEHLFNQRFEVKVVRGN
ncbi:MAG TPA: hypothetical protein ENJ95_04190 [Bacteroidetes bacterium]|nr:hypothetical protein [Bacteroidota bacterium]